MNNLHPDKRHIVAKMYGKERVTFSVRKQSNLFFAARVFRVNTYYSTRGQHNALVKWRNSHRNCQMIVLL
ncbi:hypothetical protein HA44_02580 [Mixta gaviniae]|nr:hypothetical protein HA44_02580 [Mixta gaviniae]